jgi:hypothetical protein
MGRFMAPRKTYAPLTFPARQPLTATSLAGSGKSVLWFVAIKYHQSRVTYGGVSSTIIQDIIALRDSGSVSMAYFYFDFRDSNKQNRRDLLSSLVTQLSSRSDRCFDLLYLLYPLS